MTKRLLVTLSVLSSFFGACSEAVQPPELPHSVSPGWQLSATKKQDAIWTATYSGPGTAHVRIWPTHSNAEGLDRLQKWRPQANTVAFYGDRYFAAVDWSGANPAQAASLIRAVEHVIGFQQTAR